MADITTSDILINELIKRIDIMRDVIDGITRQPRKPVIPKYISVPAFKEMTGYSDTVVRAYYKNKDLARRGILVKATDCTKQGSWLIDYEKWRKWAVDNAKNALEII
jgi:hypothetical protein